VLDRASTSDKNELLFQQGINFNEVPAWQRRGIGLVWETFDRELPMKAAYREFIERICGEV